ncbi:molybdopterin synthase sulfur carrier subunit [Helicobacter monodelphidis]|uniref:MoaD/ThiS family protein n=1 Tax=Helicobacter sp. 15-1451 TaxID=2004995 RepID=UPI000DCE8E0E|nr:MoaD/ThiS family protein [Helicobacter sp. 15-1451]RAX58379.1 molybdopterin synthase sulfur carrier subunit [Helicobacter sp. 15-1451]
MVRVKVEFLGPLQREPLELEVENLKELRRLLRRDDSLLDWLSECAVVINDEVVNSLDYPLVDGDIVMILPPVCGG